MLVNVLLLAASVFASPIDLDKRASTCVVSDYAGFANCKSSTSIQIKGPFTVPANSVVDWSGLSAGTKITFTGTVTFAKGTLDKTHDLITVGGSGISFTGTGTFDGQGAKYWDGQGANGGVKKPKMMRIKTTGKSTFSGFTVKNAPIHCFSIVGSDTTLDGITLDSADGVSLGHNTDAFDVNGSGITIQNSIVTNQDDCLAVNKASNVKFLKNQCTGGHGISIGSVASGSTVDSVLVQGCTITNSDNGVRIKTVYGATSGSVSNITYQDITLTNIAKMGIVVRQDYQNGSPTGTPVSKMPIKGVTLSNIHGTVKSGAYSVFVLCAPGECSNFSWTGISITPKKTACTGITPTGC